MLFDPDRIEVDRGQVLLAVLDSEHPSVQPGLETFHRSRPCGVVAIEGVVALEVALDRRGMRAARLMHHGYDLGLREQDSIRIAERHAGVDELLAREDHSLRGEPSLLRHT